MLESLQQRVQMTDWMKDTKQMWGGGTVCPCPSEHAILSALHVSTDLEGLRIWFLERFHDASTIGYIIDHW